MTPQCPLLIDCQAMTGAAFTDCPNFYNCHAEAGKPLKCQIISYYLTNDRGITVSINKPKLGFWAAVELPYVYDKKDRRLKVTYKLEDAGFYPSDCLLIERTTYPLGGTKLEDTPDSAENTGLYKALVVCPFACEESHPELIKQGFHRGKNIYPQWDEFYLQVKEYIGTVLVEDAAERAGVDLDPAFEWDHYTESVYLSGKSYPEHQTYYVVANWIFWGETETDEQEIEVMGRQTLEVKHDKLGKVECQPTQIKPLPQLKLKLDTTKPEWMEKKLIESTVF